MCVCVCVCVSFSFSKFTFLPTTNHIRTQREQIFNVLDQIVSQSMDNDELVKKAIRLVKRAGVPMEKTYLDKYSQYLVSSTSTASSIPTTTSVTKKELGKTDITQRRQDVEIRKQWERQHEEKQQEQEQRNQLGTTKSVGKTIASNVEGKSALSRRAARAGTSTAEGGTTKPDIFLPSVLNPDNIATIAYDKSELQKEMDNAAGADNDDDNAAARNSMLVDASNRVSKVVAKAGSNSNFEGENLGIGGLDDVLRQIRRRVWIPLAAPPQLLDELGIHPGMSACIAFSL